jgi:phage FluMu protein gp41
MLDLSTPKAPFDIALPYGLLVTVKPLTTAGMAAAQVAARRAVETIERPKRPASRSTSSSVAERH